jgi:prepilin-type N-terminal cleavage/methylation domain-containing protein
VSLPLKVPARHAGAAPRRGFTLVETVIGLFLLSVISLLVLESYRAGLGMWERRYADDRALDTTRVLLSRLRSQVKSLYPWEYHNDRRTALYFKGEGDNMQFATMVGLSSQRENGLLHAMRYALEDGPEGKRLRIEEYSWPRRDFPDGDAPLISEVLEGVEDFSLKYEISEKKVQSRQQGASQAQTAPSPSQTIEKRWETSWPPEEAAKKNETVSAISVSLIMRTGPQGREEFSETIPVMREGRDLP